MGTRNLRIHRRCRPRKPRLPVHTQRDVRLRMLAEHSRDIYFSMRFPDGRYEYISPSAEALFGYSPQDFYQDSGTLLRCVAPVWRDQVRAWLSDIPQGKVPDEIEFQIIDKAGRQRWVRQRQICAPTPDGSAWLLQGVATEVPGSRLDEKTLRESEERFRALAESWVEQVLMRINLRTATYEYISPGIERITGRTPADFYARPVPFLETVAPRWREAVAAWVDELFQGGIQSEYEYEVLHTSGQTRWVNQRGVIVRDGAGCPVVAQFVLFDVTERRRLEDALRESNQRYALVSDNMVDIIWAADENLHWTYLSPSAQTFIGMPLDVLLQRTLAEVFPPDSLPVIEQALRRWEQAKPGSPEDGPRWLLLDLKHADGGLVPVEVLARPVRDESGRITGYCGTARDIRPRIRMQRVEAALNRLARVLMECEDLGQTQVLAAACAEEITGARQALAAQRDPETGLLLGPDGRPQPEVAPEAAPEDALAVTVLHAGEEVGCISAVGIAPEAVQEARQLLGRVGSLFALAVARIRAEEALRKSERMSRKLLESMHEGVWAMDRDQNTIFVNERLSSMLGYSVAELKTMHPPDLLDAAQRPLALARMRERRMGLSGASDYEVTRKDGSLLPMHVSASPILDRSGSFEGLVMTAVDLSERKLMEGELRRNQARFEALFELSRLTTATEEQMAAFTLREGLRLTGSSAGVLFFVNGDGTELLPMAWRGERENAHTQVAPTNGQTPWAVVYTTRRPLVLNDFSQFESSIPPGYVAVERFLGVPALDGERPAAVLGLTGKAADYTVDDSLQISLLMDGMWRIVRGRRDEERIRASLREKEALLREVHHRVKNNLQVVSSLLDMAGRRLSEGEARRSMEEVRAKVQAMSLVHAQLHGESVSGAGAAGMGAGRGIDLERYVRALFRQLREIYSGGMELSIRVLLDKLELGLEQAAPLGLALNEVLANVFKHGRREGVPGRVDLRAWQEEDGQVRIEVRDNGPGLPVDLVPERAHSLGMKLMFGLVRSQLNGELTLESRPDGTCVCICFHPRIVI